MQEKWILFDADCKRRIVIESLDSRLRGNDGEVDSRLRGNDGEVDSRLRGNDGQVKSGRRGNDRSENESANR